MFISIFIFLKEKNTFICNRYSIKGTEYTAEPNTLHFIPRYSTFCSCWDQLKCNSSVFLQCLDDFFQNEFQISTNYPLVLLHVKQQQIHCIMILNIHGNTQSMNFISERKKAEICFIWINCIFILLITIRCS